MVNGLCKQCCSGKQRQTYYKYSDGHRHCSNACMDQNGRVKSIETKLMNVKYNVKSNAKNNAKNNAKYNTINNAKIASKLRETKKAENDALVAQGIGVDAALRPDAIETIALMVVKQIESIVDEDGKAYVFTSAERRIDVESFASVTT